MTPLHPFQATLVKKTQLPDHVFFLSFHIADSSLSFTPGQYIIMDVPQANSSPIKRLYSIASSNRQIADFDLLIKCVPGGIASTYINNLTPNETVSFTGPAGLFGYKQTATPKVFMTTGTGFAPIRSILSSFSPDDGVKKTLLWGMPTIKSVYLFDELRAFEKKLPSFSFFYCLSRETDLSTIPAELLHYFRLGRIDKVLFEFNNEKMMKNEYYFCGSREVVESLRLLFLSKNIDPNQLRFEKY